MNEYKGFEITVIDDHWYIATKTRGLAHATSLQEAHALVDAIEAADLKGSQGKQYRITRSWRDVGNNKLYSLEARDGEQLQDVTRGEFLKMLSADRIEG